MKFRALISAVALFALAHSTLAQGFVNLDFESATVVPTPPGGFNDSADPAQLFPGWTVGGTFVVVSYNDESLGAPAVNLIGPEFPNFVGFTPLQGSYSVYLQYFGHVGTPPTLSQTGLVPPGSESISFLGSVTGTIVTLNGVNIPLVTLSDGRVAGDISSFAGISAQLTFSTLNTQDSVFLDDIQFSSSVVPEPSAFALAALGAATFGFRRRRKSPR